MSKNWPLIRFTCCLIVISFLLVACNNNTSGLQSGNSRDFKDAVVINQFGITSISASANKPIIKTGSTLQFTSVGNTATGGSVDISRDVHWTVSNTSVANIDDNGLLTGLAQSDVTVTAQLSSFSATVNLRITDANVENINITRSDGSTNFTIEACKTLKLKAEAKYSGETLTADVTNEVIWATKATSNIAHFSTASGENGWLFTSAVDNGIDVSATMDTVSDTKSVITQDGFTSNTSGISLSPDQYTFPSPSETRQFIANATFDDGSSADITQAAIWSSDAPAIATVSNDGLASAKAVGSTVISAQCGPATNIASASITVNDTSLRSLSIDYDRNVPQQITASGDYIFLTVNSTLQLDATAHYSDGSAKTVTTDANTTWEVFPDNTVLTVDTSGLLTTKAQGTAVVKATYQGVEQNLTVTVQ